MKIVEQSGVMRERIFSQPFLSLDHRRVFRKWIVLCLGTLSHAGSGMAKKWHICIFQQCYWRSIHHKQLIDRLTLHWHWPRTIWLCKNDSYIAHFENILLNENILILKQYTLNIVLWRGLVKINVDLGMKLAPNMRQWSKPHNTSILKRKYHHFGKIFTTDKLTPPSEHCRWWYLFQYIWRISAGIVQEKWRYMSTSLGNSGLNWTRISPALDPHSE